MPEAKRERGGASYPCPKCGSPTQVLTTRRDGTQVVRRRKCLSCEKITTTYEDQSNGSKIS